MDLESSYRIHKRPPLVPNVSQAIQNDFSRYILISSSHLRLGLPSSPYQSGSPPKPCKHISSPHTCNKPRQTHSSWFDHSNSWW